MPNNTRVLNARVGGEAGGGHRDVNGGVDTNCPVRTNGGGLG